MKTTSLSDSIPFSSFYFSFSLTLLARLFCSTSLSLSLFYSHLSFWMSDGSREENERVQISKEVESEEKEGMKRKEREIIVQGSYFNPYEMEGRSKQDHWLKRKGGKKERVNSVPIQTLSECVFFQSKKETLSNSRESLKSRMRRMKGWDSNPILSSPSLETSFFLSDVTWTTIFFSNFFKSFSLKHLLFLMPLLTQPSFFLFQRRWVIKGMRDRYYR